MTTPASDDPGQTKTTDAWSCRVDWARDGQAERVADRGQSPLTGAVFKAEPDVVAALLERGVDPDAGQPAVRATAEMFGQRPLAHQSYLSGLKGTRSYEERHTNSSKAVSHPDA